jgi:uncharacterized OsmC-like protein
MTPQRIAAALKRVETVLKRRPEIGLHDDAPAAARWEGGTRVVSSHASGACIATDMPEELGGAGNEVTPGWLFRAGTASCLATSIAMAAAAEAIEITALEVVASSRSDVRGVLGMADARGVAVSAGPASVELRVRIAARNQRPEVLRALVERSQRCSPIPVAVEQATPVNLHIEVES